MRLVHPNVGLAFDRFGLLVTGQPAGEFTVVLGIGDHHGRWEELLLYRCHVW